MKIIYIAGYGRSGSTLLDIILGNNNAIINTGELCTILDEYLNKYECSCGDKLNKCSQWSNIFSNFDKNELIKYRNLILKIDSRENIFSPFKKKISTIDKEHYKAINNKIFNEIYKNRNIIVDSSKSAASASFRPIALSEILNYDIKVIHLKRNWKDVCFSIFKGSNRKIQGKKDFRISLLSQLGIKNKKNLKVNKHSRIINLVRGSLGYILANRDASLLKDKLGEKNYLQISFEDLLLEPTFILKKIEKKFDIDLTESINIIENNKSLNTGHIIGGNRMSKEKTIKLNKKE